MSSVIPSQIMADANSIARSLAISNTSSAVDPLARFTPKDWETLLALADTFFPPVDPDVLKPFAAKNQYAANDDEFSNYAELCPTRLGDPFINSLKGTISKVGTDNRNQFILIIKLLSHRSTAVLFTKSGSLLSEMPYKTREAVVLGWYHSRLPSLRKMFRSFLDTFSSSFIRSCPIGYKAIGHPYVEPNLNDQVRFATRDFFKYDILDIGRYATSTEINVDVVILGSGSGGGVVASRLSQQGYSVLVLEKGVYYPQDQLKFNEDQGHTNLYEQGGAVINDEGSLMVLAGSTLGGASTVNWSASLRTTDIVRREWVDAGVNWYGLPIYEEAMDYVMEKMGCYKNDKLNHSFTNQLILDGSEKLGYEAKEIPQNTNGHEHNCGFCCFGCRFGEKQGGVVCWLRDAVLHNGCQILDQTDVIRIIHQGKKATGIEAIVHKYGRDISLSVKAKKIVVAGGSIQSPGLLLRSNFKNKHIGQGLKLHPVTVVFGDFPDVEQNAFEKPIMTAVCTQSDDLDGKGHGPKIESVLHQPLLESHFYPWASGEDFRKMQINYNHLSALLVITRDQGSGKVYYHKDLPLTPRIDYNIHKYDSWALLQGCLTAADLLYIQGAKRIITPLSFFPIFKSDVPTESRNIKDSEYQLWRTELSKQVIEPVRVPMGTAHQMSSCRIGGKGPEHSVANARGQLWECDNVYIADASALPTASGVNPMISTMATAHVIAGNIVKDLHVSDSRL